MTDFLEDMEFTYSSKMLKCRMLKCTLGLRITEAQFSAMPSTSLSGYFKVRNSTMKLDHVGFKNVENFFHFITQGHLMKIL